MRQLVLRFLIGLTPVMLFATPLFAQPGKGFGGSFGSSTTMLMIGAMFVILYLFMIRPEQKKTKARQLMIASIKRGDRVMTSAGIFGSVDNVKDTTVIVKIAENTKEEFSKSAVPAILNSDGTEKTPDKDEKAA